MDTFDDILLAGYGYDEPILATDFIDLLPNLSRATVYQKIDSALERGTLERYDRGVYYVPRKTRFGLSKPLASQVVRRRWISDGETVFGYYSGLTLENKVGISHQVPAVLEIVTNKESKRVREVKPFGGWRKIILRKPRTPVNAANVEALMVLDLVTAIEFAGLNEYELENFRKLAQNVGREKAYEYARFYPAKTAKKLVESENYHVFA